MRYTLDTNCLENTRFYALKCWKNVDKVAVSRMVGPCPTVMAKWKKNCANPSTCSVRDPVKKKKKKNKQRTYTSVDRRISEKFPLPDSHSILCT